MRAVYRLLSLVRRYGPDPVEQACDRALQLDVISVTKIASMLERATEHTTPVLPTAIAGASTARFARQPDEFATRATSATRGTSPATRRTTTASRGTGPATEGTTVATSGTSTQLTLIPGGAIEGPHDLTVHGEQAGTTTDTTTDSTTDKESTR